jgi:AraC-like DNA-binding protein
MKRPVMDLSIKTTANEVITLEPGLPAGSAMRSISEGSKWFAEGDFGMILIEEFSVEPCTVRLFSFKPLKKLALTIATETPAICARISTGSSWHFALGSSPETMLNEGQYTLYRLNGSKEKIIFEKGKEYKSFDIIYSVKEYAKLQTIFSGIEEFIDTSKDGSRFYLKKPGRVSAEVMDIIRAVPECPYESTLRDFYLKNRLELLFFLLLTLAFKDEPEEEQPTQAEIEAVYTAEKIIVSDITRHYPIPVIARLVRLNEFRLKHVFRYIYKTGIFEYLVQARMEEAKRLTMTTELSVGEIAAKTGYQRQSSFIGAFRRHFGYTPGSVRRQPVTLRVVK